MLCVVQSSRAKKKTTHISGRRRAALASCRGSRGCLARPAPARHAVELAVMGISKQNCGHFTSGKRTAGATDARTGDDGSGATDPGRATQLAQPGGCSMLGNFKVSMQRGKTWQRKMRDEGNVQRQRRRRRQELQRELQRERRWEPKLPCQSCCSRSSVSQVHTHHKTSDGRHTAPDTTEPPKSLYCFALLSAGILATKVVAG